MISIETIVNFIQAEKSIINFQSNINELIQLSTNNERNDVIMWASPKNYEILKTVQFGTIICATIEKNDIQPNCNYIITPNPRHAFRLILEHFFAKKTTYSIAKSAIIAHNIHLFENVFIGENVVIEENVKIGNNVKIGHNTVIYANTIINDNVSIGSNNVIGSVGFGYEKDELGQYVLIPHIGNVVLEEGVEIGNCTTIDRAVIGSTILRKNVKVDNLVHIAHGVVIDENSLIIANSMIGGSTQIGKNVWVAPSSSLINKISVGNNATIGIGAVVVKSVENHKTVVGNPAKPLEKDKIQ